MEVGHHEDADSQEAVSTKNMPDLYKDDKIIAETINAKCEPQQAYLQVYDPVTGERGIKPANVNNAIKDDMPKFSCDRCPYKTKQASHLKRHQNAKHNGIRYKCDQCDGTFSIKHTLVRHVESKHQEKKRIFPCPQCEFVTTRMDYLRGHMENIHLKLKHKCDICGHMLSSKSALLTHRKLNMKESGGDAKKTVVISKPVTRAASNTTRE